MAEEESQARQKKNEERREKECYGRKRGSSLYYCTVENWYISNIYQSKAQFFCNQFLANSMILAKEESQACQKKDKERREKECYVRKRGSSLYYCTVEKLVSINLRTNSSVIS